jgi:hypothetical protein
MASASCERPPPSLATLDPRCLPRRRSRLRRDEGSGPGARDRDRGRRALRRDPTEPAQLAPALPGARDGRPPRPPAPPARSRPPPQGPRATRVGRAPVSSIWWSCQRSGGTVESISRSRSGKHHRSRTPLLTCTPRKLPDFSPLHGVKVRPFRCLCRGRDGHVLALGSPAGLPWRRRQGSPPPAGREDAAIPRDRHGGRKGFEAKSRRERRSPEPGHLMGGELGDEGGKAHDRRLEATKTERQAEAA